MAIGTKCNAVACGNRQYGGDNKVGISQGTTSRWGGGHILWRNGFVVQPEGDGATVDKGFVVNAPIGYSELLFCHEAACIVRMMRDLILPFIEVQFTQQSPLPI